MGDELFVSVEEAARRIGIGRTLAYSLCRAFVDGRPDGLRCAVGPASAGAGVGD